MFSFLREVFSEKSTISSLRIMSMIALLMSGYIAVRGLETHSDLSGLAMLCGVFLGAAFGGKVAQKSVEVKGQLGGISTVSEDTSTKPTQKEVL
jgi:hypothetical protein